MIEKEDNKIVDINKKSDEELIDYYSKVSENILLLSRLLDKNEKEEAVEKYQKIKNKL